MTDPKRSMYESFGIAAIILAVALGATAFVAVPTYIAFLAKVEDKP